MRSITNPFASLYSNENEYNDEITTDGMYFEMNKNGIKFIPPLRLQNYLGEECNFVSFKKPLRFSICNASRSPIILHRDPLQGMKLYLRLRLPLTHLFFRLVWAGKEYNNNYIEFGILDKNGDKSKKIEF